MLRVPSRECNLDDAACPACGGRHGYVGHGSYKRFLVAENGESGRAIKRVRCKGCGSTHAVLPDDVIPFKLYSASIVDSMRADREAGGMKVAEICGKYRIGTTTLYRLTNPEAPARPDQHSLAIDRSLPAPLSSKARTTAPQKPGRDRKAMSERGKETSYMKSREKT